jgi:aspartyl protease family protein
MTHKPSPFEDPGRRSPGGGGPWLVVGAIALAALAGYLIWRFPDTLAERDERVELVFYLLLIAVIGGSLIVHWRGRPGRALRQAAAWLAIALVLVVGYSFRGELGAVKDRVLGELLPHRGTPAAAGAVSFRAAADGHFRVEALVDGRPIRFLVDTGASDVVLTPDDARRLGFDPARLAYSRLSRTANGVVRGAPVTLGEVVVGPIRLGSVRATVNGAAMGQSLLGMSFLERLAGFEVRNGRLTLRP